MATQDIVRNVSRAAMSVSAMTTTITHVASAAEGVETVRQVLGSGPELSRQPELPIGFRQPDWNSILSTRARAGGAYLGFGAGVHRTQQAIAAMQISNLRSVLGLRISAARVHIRNLQRVTRNH